MKNFNIPKEKINEIVISLNRKDLKLRGWSNKDLDMTKKELLKETKEMIIEDHLLPEVNDGIRVTIGDLELLYSVGMITKVWIVKSNKKYTIYIVFGEFFYDPN